MSTVQLTLDDELVSLLNETNHSVPDTIKEFVILELYRRGTISSGRAAEMLGMTRVAFIQYASRLGIPFFSLTEDEWEREIKRGEQL